MYLNIFIDLIINWAYNNFIHNTTGANNIFCGLVDFTKFNLINRYNLGN